MKPRLLVLLLLALLWLPACSDDGVSPQPERDLSVPDLAAPDQQQVSCESACSSEASYLCVMDSKTGQCVECLDDAHCAANPAALGGRCANQLCVCTDGADCEGKVPGARCTGTSPTSCGCAEDVDCQAPLRCVGQLFGAQICAAPCTGDSDCTDPTRPHCNAVTGRCVACALDSHCKSSQHCHPVLAACVSCLRDAHCTSQGAPLCDFEQGKCIVCRTSADCKANASGSLCSGGYCTCKDASHCKGPAPWGNSCIKKLNRCGCAGATDCSGNANGPACSTSSGRCTCSGDGDCTSLPYSACLEPYKGAGYMYCQLVCASDQDCPNSRFPACVAASGKCVACTADGHCAGGWAALCNTSNKQCVECIDAADCTTSSLGSSCAAGLCACETDADCVANESGHRCEPGLSVCVCVVDADCASGKACKGQTTFGVKVCQ